MRLFSTGLLVCLVTACGGAAAKGPAWPDPVERRDPEAEDGGESLEPQRQSAVEGDGEEYSEDESSEETEFEFEEVDPDEVDGLDDGDGG